MHHHLTLRNQTNNSKLPKAQENAGDQVTIGFCLVSDWCSAWPKFSRPTTEGGKAKSKELHITYDIQSRIISFPKKAVANIQGNSMNWWLVTCNGL